MLTRFEEARIIGSRALQISMGAPALTKDTKGITSPYEIAEIEFKEKVLPISVVRTLPSNRKLYVDIEGNIIVDQ
ncbi:MAG: DNA-directed RNA polymerase subunit K [Candidatus Micrarchaeota archaeon]